MASDAHVIAHDKGGEIVDALVNGAITPGSAVYHDGTGYVDSDADSNGSPAEFFSLQHIDNDKKTRGNFARKVVIEDIDAPYTGRADQWLSTTAGEITETKPSGSDDLEQRLGYAVSTSKLVLEANWPTQVQVPIIKDVTGSGETATALDTGAVAGDALNASTEASYDNFVIPGGFVSWEANRVWTAVETDVNFDYTFSVATAEDTEQHDVETSAPDTATANAVDQAVDAIGAIDVSGAFDLAGISEPGKFGGAKFLRDTSDTDEMLYLGLELVANVV